MPEYKPKRRREPDRPEAEEQPRSGHPVLALQRSIGNHATARVLARAPATTGSVKIAGVGVINVKGGNLEEWAGNGAPDTVDVTSAAGKHSPKLEKFASERTKADVTVKITPAHKEGENLNVGGGTQLDVTDARVKGYANEGGAETWSLADFSNVKRTKTTHTIGAG